MHKARAAAKTAKAMAEQVDRLALMEAKVDRILELVERLAGESEPARKAPRKASGNDDQ